MKVGDKILITKSLEFNGINTSYEGRVGTVIEIDHPLNATLKHLYPYRVQMLGIEFCWCDGVPVTELIEELI